MLVDELAAVKLFSKIPVELIEQGIKESKLSRKMYEKKAIIHLDGDSCRQIEVVLSGEVVATRIDSQGNVFTINQFKRHDIIGATLLFSTDSTYPMTMTVVAAATVIEISQSFIVTALKYPEFMYDYIQFISNQASFLGNKIKQHMNQSIRENILIYLQNQRTKVATNRIPLETSKKELAERLGVQRTSLSRELKKMQKEGLIVFDRTSITLLN